MYARNRFSSAPATAWADVDFVAVVQLSADEVVILNSDGSETRLYSRIADFTAVAGNIRGTVTSMARTDAGAIVTYESVDHINVDAGDLLVAGSSRFDGLVDGGGSVWAQPAWLSTTLADLGWTDFSTSIWASNDNPWLAVITPEGAAPNGMLASETAGLLLVGDAGANRLVGSVGDDVLAGSGGGDALIGGAGSDWASYASASAAVTVNLADATRNAGAAAGDVLASIENVLGSAFDDTITGDARDNIIAGAQGNDTITTGAGADIVAFGRGDGVDTITDFSVDATAGDYDRIMLAQGIGVASFADLMRNDHLQLLGGRVEIVLGNGDRLILAGVSSITALSDANFRF